MPYVHTKDTSACTEKSVNLFPIHNLWLLNIGKPITMDLEFETLIQNQFTITTKCIGLVVYISRNMLPPHRTQ